MAPLADRIRPTTIDDMVGQSHLIGPNGALRKIIQSGTLPNMIFYGPSGVGKTTLAKIAANYADKKLFMLNATTASVADIRTVADSIGGLDSQNGILLYLDEIQNFNKKQQQSLLEHIENGDITLIASTTENPYFYIYNAILSRSTVFEFKPLTAGEIDHAVRRGVDILKEDYGNFTVEDDAVHMLANIGFGDVRKSLNFLEICAMAAVAEDGVHITAETVSEVSQRPAMRYDRDGDSHYDVLSAFQKSIRGSDADASLHYLARLVVGSDLISICRRLLVIAAEDIGLAYPNAITIVRACCDAAVQLGFPEARIPLAQAVILLANAPKSNSVICAIEAAIADMKNNDVGDIPKHLKDSHYKGAAKLGNGQAYNYPHDFPNNYIPQQYLPDNIKDHVYYKPGDNKNETLTRQYIKKIQEDSSQ